MKTPHKQPAVPSAPQQEQKIKDKIGSIAAVADDLPIVLIIHNFQKEMAVEYISRRGEIELGTTLKKIRQMGPAYNTEFFNPEDAKEYVPKIIEMLEHNDDNEIVSFFQQVRTKKGHPWTWHFSTIKILMRDDTGAPLLSVTTAFPIEPLHHVTSKVSRLLEENNFLRKNYSLFSRLSDREKEVLRLMALGQTAAESAEALSISVTTIETHRRNIKAKLATTSFYELTQYARSFDLI
ncbi:helix-turn-helix transcriptional regulator [Pontibacter sp. E15-1]|uniref:response regulator transcription factor n=1 Tax=Pontibacter sp. E15-1 TaxID=2919918 RepID=UPI001F4F4E3B|nr:helix-turn-helix transcriptional regulator [Pontibacter sp. E15-1]MCJ8165083.1 helix-turn-helix transcriptional regulator [Pontibacter sp. E15-1]